MIGRFLGPVLVAGLSGFAIAAITLAIVGFAAARLANGIAALSTAADAIAGDEPVSLPPAPVLELEMVGTALRRAARTIAEDRKQLKDRIAEATRDLAREAEERRNAEAALAQMQKVEAMGQLTGGIAHDFNNLLAAIIGNLDMLQRRGDLDRTARERVAGALRAAERGTKLTNQLLVFSRAERIELRPVMLGQLLRGMHDLLARTLGPQIRVVILTDPDGSPVLSEPTQLELAVLNLAINARDAMPQGGRLTVSTANLRVASDPVLPDGDYVRLSVADTGTGMPPDVAARAFEPFYTTKEVGKGTGLGLSQVFGIATRGGGTARIDTTPGQGTTVHLYLKRTMLRGEEAKPAAASAPARDAALDVLVVDDDPDVRELIVSYLSQAGHRVRAAQDGPSGLAALDAGAPDLVLIDYAMPDMTGAEVAAIVRARFPALPIVFITGFADADAIERALGRDFAILRKPFRLDELDRLVAAARPDAEARPAAS